MKRRIVCCLFVYLLFVSLAKSQNITYSVVHTENSRDVSFEILGKVGPNYLVYKNVGWKSIIQVFDGNMKELSNERLKIMPDQTLNVDFVTYPDYFVMVYQYKKNNVLFCDAVRIDALGNPIGDKVRLDTTRIGIQSGRDIYSTIYSEDKKKILVYKMHEKNEMLNIVTKLYNPDLRLLDSTRSVLPYDERREVFTPFQLANDGTIFFTRETKSGVRENISELEMVTCRPNTDSFLITSIDLEKKFIDEVSIKIDNLNDNYLINSFYYTQKRAGNIQGLFSAKVHRGSNHVKTAFYPFDDSLRLKMARANQYKFAFDNLFLKNIFVKKDGSFLLVAEDYSTETMGYTNSWNRWDYLYNNPYYYGSDYYYWNSPYYRYNRFNSFNNTRSIKYYYDNILFISLDSTLKPQWNNVLLKRQTDDDNDNYLSFGTMNVGAEINFLFIEKEKNSQIISNHSISPYGKLFRYPTLKSREAGYQFMPRLSKQVGPRQVIVPCVYRGNICFAKIDF
jgi:hypothetical protein